VACTRRAASHHSVWRGSLRKDYVGVVRLRRDFSMLLSLIAAHALLHRSTRAVDEQGRIIATPADYAAVHDLVAKLLPRASKQQFRR
jgi:hypothetical protein